MPSVFSSAGWAFVDEVRDAVRHRDVGRLYALVDGMTVEFAEQVGTMAPALLMYHTGTNPSPETVLLTARVLHRHLFRYQPEHAADVPDFAEAIDACIRGTDLPAWVRPVIFASSVVGFLLPDGADGEELCRTLEPLWSDGDGAPDER